MSILVYGLRNCDTCRKARKWLDSAGIEHDFIDLREDAPAVSTLKAWHEAVGDDLLNRRGTTWRSLPDTDKARSERNLPKLLQDYPALIKRPVLVTAEKMVVGFDEQAWKQTLV